MTIFQPAEFLLPRDHFEQWAVIACDQFTSQPEYWAKVREQVGDQPSTLNMIFPEAELGSTDPAERIASIHQSMRETLDSEVLQRLPESWIYVERTLKSGAVRRGVVGVIDLEAYDYHAEAVLPIRATEKTVLERIPPRVRIRQGAPLELSHVLMLLDDPAQNLIEPLAARKHEMRRLYDFELQSGGGPIAGYALTGELARAFTQKVEAYENDAAARYARQGLPPLIYAVGDGNHSLAAAKRCWEDRKQEHPELAGTRDPARFALVELGNIHDPSLQFEPIHRLLTGVDPAEVLSELRKLCTPNPEQGHAVRCVCRDFSCTVFLDRARGELPIGILQAFLDDYLSKHAGTLDYIHEDAAAVSLAQQPGALSFLLPSIPKDDFFRGVAKDGVLPRKTFSMGLASEKRYYLECRKIL